MLNFSAPVEGRLFVVQLLFVRKNKNQVAAADEIKTIARLFFDKAGLFRLLQFHFQILGSCLEGLEILFELHAVAVEAPKTEQTAVRNQIADDQQSAQP